MNSNTSRPRPGTASNMFKELLMGSDVCVEVTRLSDTLKVKEKTMEQQMKEIAALKSSLAVAQRELSSKQSQVEGAKEQATAAAGGAASSKRELEMAKADKKKLEAQVAELMKKNAKLQDQIARAGDKSPGIAMQVAQLQSQVRSARADADAAAEESRGLAALVRAKDKELDRMQKKVDEADVVLKQNGELENMVRELVKALDEARAEVKTLQGVTRTREADIAKLTKELDAANAALAASQASLADTAATLRATAGRAGDLEAEVGLLRDQLARTGAVAARVAASEVKDFKGEGTISIMQHLEEVKYLGGENQRLKDKVASLEKQLTVADELKNQYRCTAEAVTAGTSSRRVSVGGLGSSFTGSPLAPGNLPARRRSSLAGAAGTAAAKPLLTASMRRGSSSSGAAGACSPAPLSKSFTAHTSGISKKAPTASQPRQEPQQSDTMADVKDEPTV